MSRSFPLVVFAVFMPIMSNVEVGYARPSVTINGQWRNGQLAAWYLRNPASSPPARWVHCMAFDSARGITVLFGGYHCCDGGHGDFSDTWEWDGSSWAFRTNVGPSPRAYTAMVYDSARGVTVLFGGTAENLGYQRDTWEWNGSTWSIRTTTGPPERYWHAMVYDSSRGVTVLFGGYNPTDQWLDDTWEWDGSTWTERATAGPLARSAHAMTYDSVRGRTVLFGGVGNPPGSLGDTWEWDGTNWTLAASSGPPARVYHAMAFDSTRGLTILFGGALDYLGPDFLRDTWEWDGVSWRQALQNGPDKGVSPAMAFDSQRSAVVLFGGYGATASAETWEYQVLPNGVPAVGGIGLAIMVTLLLVAGGVIAVRRTHLA